MGKAEKLLARFIEAKSTFVWTDFCTLMSQLGYEKREMAGSRVRFYHPLLNHTVMLHKPHPENYIKGGALKSVKEALKQVGVIENVA